MTMNQLLDVKHVDKYYGNKSSITKALNQVSFAVDKGEFTAIMGASGSGKTTLLNCIATIDRVTSGSILLDGIDVTTMKSRELAQFRRERLGFIFQEFNLLDTLTVSENIVLPLSVQKTKPEETIGKLGEIADALDISNILEQYPYELSGGQKQRVSAARALITKPSLILADEPTGALDSHASQNLLECMSLMNMAQDATILMVTHDAYAASFANRVIFLKDGQLFHELEKGADTRTQFFSNIMDVVRLLGAKKGGEQNDW